MSSQSSGWKLSRARNQQMVFDLKVEVIRSSEISDHRVHGAITEKKVTFVTKAMTGSNPA
jgi:hypothetical protein